MTGINQSGSPSDSAPVCLLWTRQDWPFPRIMVVGNIARVQVSRASENAVFAPNLMRAREKLNVYRVRTKDPPRGTVARGVVGPGHGLSQVVRGAPANARRRPGSPRAYRQTLVRTWLLS